MNKNLELNARNGATAHGRLLWVAEEVVYQAGGRLQGGAQAQVGDWALLLLAHPHKQVLPPWPR